MLPFPHLRIGGSCEKCVGDCKECLKEKECAVCEPPGQSWLSKSVFDFGEALSRCRLDWGLRVVCS